MGCCGERGCAWSRRLSECAASRVGWSCVSFISSLTPRTARASSRPGHTCGTRVFCTGGDQTQRGAQQQKKQRRCERGCLHPCEMAAQLPQHAMRFCCLALSHARCTDDDARVDSGAAASEGGLPARALSCVCSPRYPCRILSGHVEESSLGGGHQLDEDRFQFLPEASSSTATQEQSATEGERV